MVRNPVALARRQEQVRFQMMLLVIQLAIASLSRKEFVVVAALRDLSCLDYQYLVRTADRRKPVRDHKSRTALHQVLQTLLDELFALGIKRGCCFVEDEDSRVGKDSS